MDFHTIHIKNQSPDSHTYTLCSDEIYLLESTKHVLVSPLLNSGTSWDISIYNKFYVWAKLNNSSSQQVVTEVDVGTSLLLKDDGQQATFRGTNSTAEPECFSISIDSSFLGDPITDFTMPRLTKNSDRGVFGFGLRVSPSGAFHPLTTTKANEAATYNIQPSRVYEVAINEQYGDGDELLSDVPPTLSVIADFQSANTGTATVVHCINGATDEMYIEDPIVLQNMQEELDQLHKEAEKKRQAAADAQKLAAEKATEEERQATAAAEKVAAEKVAAEKVAKEKREATAAAEKVAAQNAAESAAAAERARSIQSQSIPSGHSIAATAWSAWHMRVYFQDGQGRIRESRHDDGIWSGGDAQSILLTAKMGTSLAAISWDSGRQVRPLVDAH
jgi:hypothetical protein